MVAPLQLFDVFVGKCLPDSVERTIWEVIEKRPKMEIFDKKAKL